LWQTPEVALMLWATFLGFAFIRKEVKHHTHAAAEILVENSRIMIKEHHQPPAA